MLPALPDGSLRICSYYGYVWIKLNGRWKQLHRHKWEKYRGPIPPGCVVHHKDEDKTNNALRNLVCLTRAEHAALHTKGRQLTEEVKQVMSAKAKERNLRPAYNAMIRARALEQHAQGNLGKRRPTVTT